MGKFNLIMISAMYENGGNTTHRFLDGHPELFVYPFESQVGTGYNNDFLFSYVPIRYRWPEFQMNSTPSSDYEAYWDEELKTLLRVPSRSKFRDCGLQMDESVRKERYVNIVEKLGRTRANSIRAYFESTFDAWKNYNRTGREKYYVGYSPNLVLDAEKVLTDFPEGHMIHVARNPYSGYADQFRRPFPPSLERYAHTWAYMQLLALTYRDRFPGRFHILRFEDLIADRRKAMTDLLSRMGLGFSEKCLYPSFNGIELTQVTPWGTIRTATQEENLATANELTAPQKSEVRSITAVMHRLMGYERYLETGTVAPIG